MAKFFSNPEENYQNLVNSSADPILSVDQAGRILLYNPRTVSMFQLNEVGVLNSSVYALLAPTDAERLRADIGIFRDTGCSIIVGQTVEMTATDTLGNAFPIEVSISGRRLIDNVVVTLIMRDITVRRKHDEALIREERCSRTLVEELRKADELKNTFISVLSHEIRNPLSAMSAGLSLLETTEDQAIVNRTREILRRQTGQLCRLVDDLLEVTRITQGKIRLKKELTDICRLTLNIAEDYRLQYELKGVDLSVRLPDAALIAMADTLRLSQCISNLLNNALKYTQPGGAVHLSLEHGENEAIITVADNGRGIDPANLPNLFSFFAQVENASETSPRGLGLGLAIAKGFTELHGGSIMAFSEGIGKGSVFTVRIPAAAAETAASACEESIQETYKKQAAAAVKE